MGTAQIHENQQEGCCSIWNIPCPHTENCISKNRKRIGAILDMKNETPEPKISSIAKYLLRSLEDIYMVHSVNSEYKTAFLHFLSNGLVMLYERPLNCDYKTTSKSKYVHNHLIVIVRLRDLLELSKTMNEDQKLEFLTVLKDKVDRKLYDSKIETLYKIAFKINNSGSKNDISINL